MVNKCYFQENRIRREVTFSQGMVRQVRNVEGELDL